MATVIRIHSIFAACLAITFFIIMPAAGADDSMILYDRAISSFLSELKNKKTIDVHDLEELGLKDAHDELVSDPGDFFASAEFLLLDKVMAKPSSILIRVVEPFYVENIKIELYGCWILSGRPNNGSMALLKIFHTDADNDVVLFSGWMFSRMHTLGTFMHAIYDLHLVACR